MDKQSFFDAYDLARDMQPVDLPDGRQVHIRPLSARGADEFENACLKTPTKARATLIRWTLCDERGALLCTDKDLESLGNLPKTIADPLVEAITKHNHLRAEPAEVVGE